MTLQSFNARLKKCDPYLRVRRRTGWIIFKAEGFAMAGLYRGCRYLGHSGITGDLPYHTRPTLYRLERIPGYKEPQRYIHSRMRRGRYELVNLLIGKRVIRHRWQRQLLII